MDTIAYRLIRYEGLKKENHLLNKQVEDLTLINEKQSTQLNAQKYLIKNKDSQIVNLKDAVGELEILVGESEQITKYAKKQVRKRWVIISVTAFIGGFTTAVLVL